MTTGWLQADIIYDDGVYDTENNFASYAAGLKAGGYSCYYFGDSSDGARKTGKPLLVLTVTGSISTLILLVV